MKAMILAVDDTPASLKLMSDILVNEGYEVRAAINGELALHAAAAQHPDLILLDINMPEMDGFEICRRLKRQEQTREIPIIFVSAMGHTDEKLEGFRLGAVDYITKPFEREELLARVRNHIELYRLHHNLHEMVQERTASLKESEIRLKNTLLDAVTAIATTVEMRDPYTAGHQRRVADIAVAVGKELGLSDERIEGLRLASVVHDVGKVKIPAEILSKPGKLDPVEYELIKQHSESGYDILKSISFPWPIAEMVRQHHEHMDGSGYPRGLKGDGILLEARIISVADVIEAMAAHRPYRPGLGLEAALEEIEGGRGTRYDADVVDAASRLFREKGYRIEL